MRRACAEFPRDDDVFRQHDFAAAFLRLGHDRAGGAGKIMFAKGFSDRQAARGEEGVGHAAADDDLIDLFGKGAQKLQLGRHFRAADHGDHRTLRRLQRVAQRLQLRLHKFTGGGGQQARQSLG